jgi:hypothetical protein
MKLSIVIVNWNTCELLKQCLASVYANPPSVEYDIWVVDNASKDGSSEMVQECFPQVRLVNNGFNAGFAYANNLALRQAEGEYALLLNSDTIVKPNALQAMVQFMDDHSEAGAVGSRVLNPDGSLQVSCYIEPTLKNEFLRMFHLEGLFPGSSYKMTTWELEKAREVDILQGACLMLRGKTLEEVGLLDEDFFMYSEDYDLCTRIQKARWRLYWVPWAEIIHFGGQSTRQVATEMFVRLYQSKLLCMRKHYGGPAAAVYKFILMLSALSRLSVTPLSWLERPQERQRHRSLSENYRRLLTALPNM